MRLHELFVIGAAHLFGFSVAATIIHLFTVGDSGFAFVAGACTGSAAFAILYHRRVSERAPFSVKAASGGVLSGMAILAGLASQGLLGWMKFPDVVIPISALGSFFFPWAIFGAMQRAYKQKE